RLRCGMIQLGGAHPLLQRPEVCLASRRNDTRIAWPVASFRRQTISRKRDELPVGTAVVQTRHRARHIPPPPLPPHPATPSPPHSIPHPPGRPSPQDRRLARQNFAQNRP